MNFASLIGLAGILGVATASAPPAAEPAHPTIRHMAGAQDARALPAGKTALLVIDVQKEYFAGGRMPIPDGDAALARPAVWWTSPMPTRSRSFTSSTFCRPGRRCSPKAAARSSSTRRCSRARASG